MRELLRTNDLVILSVVQSMLGEMGIYHVVLDGNMSTLEGSIGAIQRRIMVDAERYGCARKTLEEAGLGHELRHGMGDDHDQT